MYWVQDEGTRLRLVMDVWKVGSIGTIGEIALNPRPHQEPSRNTLRFGVLAPPQDCLGIGLGRRRTRCNLDFGQFNNTLASPKTRGLGQESWMHGSSSSGRSSLVRHRRSHFCGNWLFQSGMMMIVFECRMAERRDGTAGHPEKREGILLRKATMNRNRNGSRSELSTYTYLPAAPPRL